MNSPIADTACTTAMKGINQNRIKLSQLRILVVVAEYNNFSEAALHLEISQSAVSHAIATLEEDLGVSLFTRGRHGAHLTSVGEVAINYARQILQQLEKLSDEVNLHKGLQGGQVRVGAFRSAATHLLSAILVKFRHKYPQIAIAITEYADSEGVKQALVNGKVDIGFIDVPATNELETWEILRDQYIVLLPPKAKLDSTILSWEQLTAYPLITDAPGNCCYERFRNYLQACGVSWNVAYEIREDSTKLSLVTQGLGAAIMPRLAAEPIPPEVQVCSLPVPLERVISAAVLADSLQPPAVFAFLDTLKVERQQAIVSS